MRMNAFSDIMIGANMRLTKPNARLYPKMRRPVNKTSGRAFFPLTEAALSFFIVWYPPD